MSILFLWCGKNITIFNWIVEKCCKITGPHFLSYFHTLFLLERELQAIFTKVFTTFLLERELKAIFTKVFIILLWGRELAIFMQVFTLFLEQEYLPRYSPRFPWSKNLKGFLLQCYWREYFKLFSPRFSHHYWSKNDFYQSIHHIIVEERFLSDFLSGFHLIVIGVRVLRYFHHGFFWRENTCDILLFICIIYIIV